MHTVNRRLRWWRGLAYGLAIAGLLGWGLPLGLAREKGSDKDKGEVVRGSQCLWAEPDVCGLFFNNVGSFSDNVGLRVLPFP
jgi:hypothetical protein